MAKVSIIFALIIIVVVVSKSHYINNYLTYRQLRFCDGYRMCCNNFQITGYRYNYWEYRDYNNLKYYCNRYLGYCRFHFYPGYYQSGIYFTLNPCRVCKPRYARPFIFNNDDEDINNGSGDKEIFI
nr:uncharacterized protein LOC111423427 [Onthophagus taurus]